RSLCADGRLPEGGAGRGEGGQDQVSRRHREGHRERAAGLHRPAQGQELRQASGTGLGRPDALTEIPRGRMSAMALYELRTYTLYVGKMAEAVKLYQQFGFPALHKGGHDKNLVGYFQGDTGVINQIVHLWKYEDDAARRAHWAAVFANTDFTEGFVPKFRPLVMTQEVKLLHAAPWGPHPST